MARKIKAGDYVKMSASLKKALKKSKSAQHVREFGGCIGVVEGPVDYGTNVGPELDVRWLPSKLRYGYSPEHLVLVKKPKTGVVNYDKLDKILKIGKIYKTIKNVKDPKQLLHIIVVANGRGYFGYDADYAEIITIIMDKAEELGKS